MIQKEILQEPCQLSQGKWERWKEPPLSVAKMETDSKHQRTFIEARACIFFLFWPPCSIWNIQTRAQIQATAAAMLDPLTHWAEQGIEPASWHCRDAANPMHHRGNTKPTLSVLFWHLFRSFWKWPHAFQMVSEDWL